MDTLKNILSPLSRNAGPLQDTIKLVVIGGTAEATRRVVSSTWNNFVDSFYLTACFKDTDSSYDWLMHWLSKQEAWGRSREFEITTRGVSRNSITQCASGDIEDDDDDTPALRKRKISFLPSVDTTHTIYYHGHWLRITRSMQMPRYMFGATLKISVIARSNDIFKKLILEAKREYQKDTTQHIHIFMANTAHVVWRWNGSRQKRSLSSIILQPEIKDMLVADCKDFLMSEEWYADRGIPFRRGYLLHGVPGSGKTSLIHALAGELGLDIYVASLSSKGMSDNTLSTLMSNIPSRCILLLEDLDAAFTRSVSRDSSSTGVPTEENSSEKDANTSTLSLSGLLNSIDGVAAAEGRLLFATTNHIERLDPALSRPGRMDVWVNFANATKWQARGIFKCFFPSKPKSSSTTTTSRVGKLDVSQKDIPQTRGSSFGHSTPSLEEDEIDDLAKRFADAIPEGELSVAALQGYLLKNKLRPRESVDEVGQWVLEERQIREKLKKEKAEREKKEAEEKQSKEAESKEKEKVDKEPEEKESKEKKERAKSKKGHRNDAVWKLESSDSSGSTIVDSSSSTSIPTAPSEPDSSDKTESGSSSESDISSGGMEADTEESVSSEEEAEKKAEARSSEGTGKEKWVAVKGQSETTV